MVTRFRILHVLFSSRIAGSERYCIDLANEQACQGHEVHVAGTHDAPMAAALSDAVTYHGLRLPFFRGWQLGRLMADHSIDVCHAHLSHGCKALARAPGKAVKMATLHVGYKARQHARLDALVCVNKAQMARVDGYSGEVRVIPNWMPSATDSSRVDLRRELGLSPKTRIVGTVGRLHPSKGCDVLIEAFRRGAPDDAALVILGEGPQLPALKTMAKEDRRIHFLGYRADVDGILPELDLFVSPSREETFGLAILEAMRAGLPVITTATEGPCEYLRPYPITFVSPGSVEELTAALTACLPAGGSAPTGRIQYDLAPFSQSQGVASILEFYARMTSASTKPGKAASGGSMVANASET